MIGKVLTIFLINLNYLLHACEIDPESQIGPGFLLHHTMGVVIGRATLGKNVSLYMNVTIGLKGTDDLRSDVSTNKYPTIGDEVSISAGAVVLGPITVGDHSRIGAKAVVLQNVPAFATAVGIPARIIEKSSQPVGLAT